MIHPVFQSPNFRVTQQVSLGGPLKPFALTWVSGAMGEASGTLSNPTLSVGDENLTSLILSFISVEEVWDHRSVFGPHLSSSRLRGQP